MKTENIRNFSIIAHIDHGKSTLADRMLEMTGTIEKRKMKEQVLDQMELERERGITIKMQPVRMSFKEGEEDYTLNLIDTPGHIDFSYEVSRALKAVEGALLLVDSTQGVQAQTLTTLSQAQEQNLVIIPVITKIDSDYARKDDVKQEIAELLDCSTEDVYEVSGKTGEGVEALLNAIVERIPPPKSAHEDTPRALVFDFEYSNHKGVIVYVRVFEGNIQGKDKLSFAVAKKNFNALEVGYFAPDERETERLGPGEIGYIVTGIKEAGVASVGDTIIAYQSGSTELSGYEKPRPVVWASLFPESQDDFTLLRQALDRLSLSDSSLTFEEESSGVLGRGFRSGFLGMLHLEIITERLEREFDLSLIVASPSIEYEVITRTGETIRAYTPMQFPEHGEIEKVREPWITASLITPSEYISVLMQLFYEHEADVKHTKLLSDGRTQFDIEMPLRELMRGFFDDVKRVTSGYGSLSYEILPELRDADVVRLDILVAEEIVPAFSRIISKRRIEEESKDAVNRLHELLPQQLFKTKIQAQALGRIISSKTLSALRKDVTGYLYGGDVTRKRKLLEKQKKGKKKMQARAKANIPHEVFLKMIRRGD